MLDIIKLTLAASVILGVTVALPCWLLYYYGGRGRGNMFRRKFAQMGVLRGRTYQQIVAHAGKPFKETIYPNGLKVAVWGGIGYNVVLKFQNEVCQGVTSETNF